MKKIYTIPVFLLLTTFLYSQQEWAPIGTKWYQNVGILEDDQWPDFFPLIDYTIIESTGDTLVNDLTLRKVGDYLTYQDGYKVYLWWGDSLNLIYDFDVEPGDTATFNLLSCGNEIVTLEYDIEAVSVIEVNGQQLKKITCRATGYYFPEIYEYIEKIGTRFPIENAAVCAWIPEYTPPWTRCYTDDVIDYKTDKFLSFGDFDCDYQQTTATEDVEIPIFKIFPNPISNGEFYLENQNLPPNAEVHIYNPLGQFISKEKWTKSKQIFTLTKTGLYYVMIFSEDKRVATRTIVAVK